MCETEICHNSRRNIEIPKCKGDVFYGKPTRLLALINTTAVVYTCMGIQQKNSQSEAPTHLSCWGDVSKRGLKHFCGLSSQTLAS